jgi:hypothetical protein
MMGSVKKSVLVVVVVIVVAGLVAWGYFGLRIGQKVYGEVAGHKIYKSEIVAMQKSSPHTSTRQVVQVLLQKYLDEKVAAENHVVVTAQDTQDQIKAATAGNPNNAYDRQVAINDVYESMIQAAVTDHFAGKFIIAHFDQNIPMYTSTGAMVPSEVSGGIGDPAVIAADQAYAENFITATYQKITTHKESFDQGMQAEQNDPKIGSKALGGVNHSGEFNSATGDFSNTVTINQSSVAGQIKALKAGQISKPLLAKEDVSAARDGSKLLPAYYLIVDMTDVRNAHTNYYRYMIQARQRLGYKSNVA